jgi:hypothetical protein
VAAISNRISAVCALSEDIPDDEWRESDIEISTSARDAHWSAKWRRDESVNCRQE